MTADITYTFDAVIPHVHEPCILLLERNGGWVLPAFLPERRTWFGGEHVNGPVRDLLGLQVTSLDTVYRLDDRDSSPRRVHTTVALENHSPLWMPPSDGRWVGRATLADLPLVMPEQRPALENLLRETETGEAPALRVPWARPGWYAHACEWMRAALQDRGYELLSPIEQLQVWCLSSIMRVSTNRGTVYFKAVPPVFAAEARITETAATLFPDHVPAPLAIDHDRGWMLPPEFGGDVLDSLDFATWHEAATLFARMQIASIAHRDALLASGCRHRPLEALCAQIRPILTDPQVLAGTGPAEVEQLQALIPQLQTMCEWQVNGFPFWLRETMCGALERPG